MNKKKKSTNTSPYPDEVIDRLARAFYPAILACWNSEEGQREFAAWQAEQAHRANNEKQEVPAGELPVVHIAIRNCLWIFRVRPQGAPCFCFYGNSCCPIRNEWVISTDSQRGSLIQNPPCKSCTDFAALRPIGAFPSAQQCIL